MKTPSVNIDFKALETGFRKFVRSKAIAAGSTIVYLQNGKLVEENPATNTKRELPVSIETGE